ncbi:MAG: DUF4838 domain-containing protein, partial [Planctomycetaceae bacterium]|nr:DUF4838 domain-containing protein [Planctomycetaceae bacterium]
MKEKLASPLLFLILVSMQFSLPAAEPEKSLTFYREGDPVPVIFVDLRASAPEKFAAHELRDHLQEIIGREITIRTDHWLKEEPEGAYIAVGKSRFTADIDNSALETERYIIDVGERRIAIVGGRDRQRGVLYGVYEFLERLGVRWYRPEPWGRHLPQLKEISLPPGRIVSPGSHYEYRSVLAGGFTRNAEWTLDQADATCLWALRNRLNGADPGSDPRYGGQVSPQFDHIYYQLFPVEEYFDSHPEFFCMYKGERRKTNPDAPLRPDNPTGLQLCLGNPELQELFAQKIIDKARGRYDLDKVTFSATPNDACPFCECDQCKAMDDPRDPKSMSNRVCAFTNIIARKVASEVPGARISLNAYSDWTAPPTIVDRIEPNVQIHLALINGWSDYTRPFHSSPSWNDRTRESFQRWKALGVSRIYTYEYWSGYAWPGPLPLVKTVADRLRAYREFNVRGVYSESTPSWGPQGLDHYFTSQLLWNPDLDLDAELIAYYRNFYGPAELPMRRYHEKLLHALETSNLPVHSGGRGMHLLMTPTLIDELGKHIAAARASVQGQPLYERRLRGVAEGFEFSAAVSRLLQLKKQTGIEVSIPASTGSYLKSPQAETAYEEILRIIRRNQSGDAVFDSFNAPPYIWYLAEDLLKNDALGYRK